MAPSDHFWLLDRLRLAPVVTIYIRLSVPSRGQLPLSSKLESVACFTNTLKHRSLNGGGSDRWLWDER